MDGDFLDEESRRALREEVSPRRPLIARDAVELRCALDDCRRQLAEANAGAAAMRRAIEWALHPDRTDPDFYWHESPSEVPILSAALSSTAGADLLAEVRRLRGLVDSQWATNKAVCARADQAEADLSAAHRERDEARQQREELNWDRARLQVDLSAARAELERLKADAAQGHASCAAELRSRGEDLQRMVGELATARAEVERLTFENSELHQTAAFQAQGNKLVHAQLRAEVERLTAGVTNLRAQRDAMQADRDSAYHSMEAEGAEVERLKAELDSKKSEASSAAYLFQRDLDTKDQRIAELEADNRAWEEECDRRGERIAELEKALRLAAPHHQGWHSRVGEAIRAALHPKGQEAKP